MAKAKIDAPGPLRNLEASEVAQILKHPFLSRPDDIDEEAWSDGIEKVRADVRALKLNVEIPKTIKFLTILCGAVNKCVRESERVENDILDDPVVNAIRRRIGLFIYVRVALGRHEQFERLKAEIIKRKGRISLAQFENNKNLNLRNIAQIIRKALTDAKTIEGKTTVITVIQEFLAEQTGLSAVEFIKLRFKDFGASHGPRTPSLGVLDEPAVTKKPLRSLKKLGIELPHQAEVDDALRTTERLHQKLIAAIENSIRAIDELVRNIDKEIRAAETETVHLEQQYDKMAEPLKEYDIQLKNLEERAAELLKSLIETGALLAGSTDLPKDKAKLVADAKEGLAAKFSEPLRQRDEIEADIEATQKDSGVLDGTKKELIAERVRLVKIREMFVSNAQVRAVAPAAGVAPAIAGGSASSGADLRTSRGAARSARPPSRNMGGAATTEALQTASGTVAEASSKAPSEAAAETSSGAPSGAAAEAAAEASSEAPSEAAADDDTKAVRLALFREVAMRRRAKKLKDGDDHIEGDEAEIEDDESPGAAGDEAGDDEVGAGRFEDDESPGAAGDEAGDDGVEAPRKRGRGGRGRSMPAAEREDAADAEPEPGQITDYDDLRNLTGDVVFAKVTERNSEILRGKGFADIEIGDYVPFKVQRSQSSANEVALHPLTASDRSAADIIPSKTPGSQLSLLNLCLFRRKPKKLGAKGSPGRARKKTK